VRWIATWRPPIGRCFPPRGASAAPRVPRRHAPGARRGRAGAFDPSASFEVVGAVLQSPRWRQLHPAGDRRCRGATATSTLQASCSAAPRDAAAPPRLRDLPRRANSAGELRHAHAAWRFHRVAAGRAGSQDGLRGLNSRMLCEQLKDPREKRRQEHGRAHPPRRRGSAGAVGLGTGFGRKPVAGPHTRSSSARSRRGGCGRALGPTGPRACPDGAGVRSRLASGSSDGAHPGRPAHIARDRRRVAAPAAAPPAGSGDARTGETLPPRIGRAPGWRPARGAKGERHPRGMSVELVCRCGQYEQLVEQVRNAGEEVRERVDEDIGVYRLGWWALRTSASAWPGARRQSRLDQSPMAGARDRREQRTGDGSRSPTDERSAAAPACTTSPWRPQPPLGRPEVASSVTRYRRSSGEQVSRSRANGSLPLARWWRCWCTTWTRPGTSGLRSCVLRREALKPEDRMEAIGGSPRAWPDLNNALNVMRLRSICSGASSPTRGRAKI